MPSDEQKLENQECEVITYCNPLWNIAGAAICGLVGWRFLPFAGAGYASIAAAAGTPAAVTSAPATGGAILLIPHYFLARQLANNLAHKPILHFCLQSALAITTAFCAGLLGAAILEMVVKPIGLCVLAGNITFAVFACAGVALYSIIEAAMACINNSCTLHTPPNPDDHPIPSYFPETNIARFIKHCSGPQNC